MTKAKATTIAGSFKNILDLQSHLFEIETNLCVTPGQTKPGVTLIVRRQSGSDLSST
jgi:hypothetical protein